jgi:hypothetical protein
MTGKRPEPGSNDAATPDSGQTPPAEQSLATLPVWAGGSLAPRVPRPSEGDGFFLVTGMNLLLSAGLVAAALMWMHQTRPPAIAVLDVAELYRLKEAQVTALLVEPRTTDTQRAQALRQVTEFGQEVASLMQTLPQTCRCLVLARGSVLARSTDLPDLTDEARKRLGL